MGIEDGFQGRRRKIRDYPGKFTVIPPVEQQQTRSSHAYVNREQQPTGVNRSRDRVNSADALKPEPKSQTEQLADWYLAEYNARKAKEKAAEDQRRAEQRQQEAAEARKKAEAAQQAQEEMLTRSMLNCSDQEYASVKGRALIEGLDASNPDVLAGLLAIQQEEQREREISPARSRAMVTPFDVIEESTDEELAELWQTTPALAARLRKEVSI